MAPTYAVCRVLCGVSAQHSAMEKATCIARPQMVVIVRDGRGVGMDQKGMHWRQGIWTVCILRSTWGCMVKTMYFVVMVGCQLREEMPLLMIAKCRCRSVLRSSLGPCVIVYCRPCIEEYNVVR